MVGEDKKQFEELVIDEIREDVAKLYRPLRNYNEGQLEVVLEKIDEQMKRQHKGLPSGAVSKLVVDFGHDLTFWGKVNEDYGNIDGLPIRRLRVALAEYYQKHYLEEE